MAAASAVARARTGEHTSVDYTITLQGYEKVATKKMKAGETVRFSSGGWFRIEFPDEWPFTKPRSNLVSYKVGRRWKSRILTLVPGKEAHFNCFRKYPKTDTIVRQEYGGEVKPR